jgi:deazaflavin-dependent oxidoreductase (nitroreductase family)
MYRRLNRVGSGVAVWLYARSGGRVGGRSRGTIIGLLTVPGRRSGIDHTVAIAFFDCPLGYVVAGSAAGSAEDPEWFKNLRDAGRASLLLGRDRSQVEAREAVGAERDALWRDVVLAQAPERRRYEKKSGRVIPIAVLSPASRDS